MKKVIVLLIISNIVFSSAIFLRQRLKRSSGSSSSDIEWTVGSFHFSQKLDHFNPGNSQKWDQRYWISTSHYKKGGPAFLLINGEWAVNGENEFNDSWGSYAKKLYAACFSLEHRFYGESWPANENFHYLSGAQALADIANFIKSVTETFKLPKDTKWILFGCSYAGMLAAWARLKYPHLVHGAVASSAPIASKVDYYDFEQIVEKSLKSYDPRCVESITNVTEEIARLINDTENVKNISRMLHSCDDREEDNVNVAKILFSDMVSMLSSAAQYNDTTAINIPYVCNIMINHDGTKLEAFDKLRQAYLKSLEDDDVDYSADRSWRYQVCSEFGGFSSYNKTPSLSPLSHLLPIENEIKEQCEPFFGPKFGIKELNEKTNHANLLHGGFDFNARNTLFIQGSVDPWYTTGIYKTLKGSLYETIFINGTSHCSDVSAASHEDIPELKKARKEIFRILKKWLKI